MVPISINKFVDSFVKNNPGTNAKDFKKDLKAAAERKLAGATCFICDQPIWALGSAITETDMCFTCTTGESDHSEDYEIESVCWN